MDELIRDAIFEALSGHANFFTVELGEILVDDDDLYSVTFSFAPKPIVGDECIVSGKKHFLQFDVDKVENKLYLVFGEDTHHDVTFAHIYAQLYWCEATEGA